MEAAGATIDLLGAALAPLSGSFLRALVVTGIENDGFLAPGCANVETELLGRRERGGGGRHDERGAVVVVVVVASIIDADTDDEEQRDLVLFLEAR